MLKFGKFTQFPLKRFLSTSNNVLEHLKDRTLIRVSGPEVSNFLQGLITNDIEHLNTELGSMYTMFLNSRGRILYDTIIYRCSEEDTYLVECDSQASDTLQKHLKLYRVRRKIDIASLKDELKIYVLFNPNSIREKVSDKLNESSPPTTSRIHRDLFIYRDPRIIDLGSRIIAKIDLNVIEQISEISGIETNPDHKKNYRWLRYSLGVGEGIHDLPPGDSFPLECNCDYLHGVSFHKGCYVGQELTARVHHTGVVRKRLMPIRLTKSPTKAPDEKIVHENVNLGKLRGIENNAGLGLLRITKALAVKEIKLGDGFGATYKPKWWPTEAPKEKINVSKVQ
ncbi:GCV T domain containing protein [Asbolus verrucosus]|uniref:GCV T domain containing protein n=1 Tax=Asbolus verrucosus TaxID=1661398 RepID=A0A482V895_ASBVE|nr:GCV T domain containing protein [Asbolus verrucosus]